MCRFRAQNTDARSCDRAACCSRGRKSNLPAASWVRFHARVPEVRHLDTGPHQFVVVAGVHPQKGRSSLAVHRYLSESNQNPDH